MNVEQAQFILKTRHVAHLPRKVHINHWVTSVFRKHHSKRPPSRKVGPREPAQIPSLPSLASWAFVINKNIVAVVSELMKLLVCKPTLDSKGWSGFCGASVAFAGPVLAPSSRTALPGQQLGPALSFLVTNPSAGPAPLWQDMVSFPSEPPWPDS